MTVPSALGAGDKILLGHHTEVGKRWIGDAVLMQQRIGDFSRHVRRRARARCLHKNLLDPGPTCWEARNRQSVVIGMTTRSSWLYSPE